MWIDPKELGVFFGNCSEYCGTQHAKMELRVVVDTPEDFAKWIAQQQQQTILHNQVKACYSERSSIVHGRWEDSQEFHDVHMYTTEAIVRTVCAKSRIDQEC